MSNHRYDVEDYATMFKALSNPHRLTIFMQLMERCCSADPCCKGSADISAENEGVSCVSQIARCCDVAPSTISHHLKELRTAGLLKMEKRGKFVDCWVEPETLNRMSQFFVHHGDSQKV